MDAKDQLKDVVPAMGGDSKDIGQQDSKPQKVYTEDEVEAKFSQQRSVLDQKVSKLEKELANFSDRAKDAESQLSQWRKDRDEAELEAARDEPDKLTLIQQRQKVRDKLVEVARRESELNTREEKVKEANAQAEEFRRTQQAAEISVKHGVDFDSLIKFTDGSPEAMEELAKKLPKTGEHVIRSPLHPDSGRTIGGTDLSQLSPDEKIRYGLTHRK